MNHLNFEYVPLTFISDHEEIKKQIRNTLILIHLFEKYNSPVRLEKLIEGTQYGYNASALQSGKNKFLRISDIHESKVNWETVPYCNCDDKETYLLKKDDILIARTGGTTGKSFKIDNPPANSIYAGYLIRIRAKQEVIPDYIYLFLHSFAYWSQIVNLNERNFRPKANAENLKSLILPDCSKDIQTDAVKISNGKSVKGYEELYAEIEKVLMECDKTQEVQRLLTEQLTQLELLNQTILQEAVQGKLVPAPSPLERAGGEASASELLKRIKAEKAKSGKKEKPLPPIKPEEIPFEIPKNWVWCRLGEICSKITDGFHNTPPKISVGFPYIAATHVKSDKIDWDSCHYVSEKFHRELYIKTNPKKGEVLVVNIGAGCGTPAIIDVDFEFSFKNTAILKFDQTEIHNKYIFYYFLLKRDDFYKDLTKGGLQPFLSLKILNEIVFPLPPLSEQTRIVAEIEKQLALTKQLKEHIIANQYATEQLLKALLHGAFEVEEKKEN